MEYEKEVHLDESGIKSFIYDDPLSHKLFTFLLIFWLKLKVADWQTFSPVKP
jgi:hypothetical protein